MKNLIFASGLVLGDKKSAPPTAAKTAAKPAKPEAPPEMTAELDMGAVAKDPDVKSFVGLTMRGPRGVVMANIGTPASFSGVYIGSENVRLPGDETSHQPRVAGRRHSNELRIAVRTVEAT